MVATGNALDKLEDNLKKDSVFAYSSVDNLNMKKQKSKELYAHMQKGIFKILPFHKMKENNKMLREYYEDYFIKKFKPELKRHL